MSQQNPVQIGDTNPLDGWKRIGANAVGIIGSIIVGAITDPAHAAAANQATALALTLTPSAIAGLYTIGQSIVDAFKAHAAGQVAASQAAHAVVMAANPPAPTDSMTPEARSYENRPQGAQIADGQIVGANKPSGSDQTATTNLVALEIQARQATVTTVPGAIAELQGVIGTRLQAFIQQCADDNLSTPAAIQIFAQQFLGVKLTTQQCSTIQSVMGLPAIVTTSAGLGDMSAFLDAFNQGRLGPEMQQALINAAQYYEALNTLNTYSQAVLTAPDSASRSLALQQFGIPKSQADHTETAAGSVYYRASNEQYVLFNAAKICGLSDTITGGQIK
jgi:hypothetical protein